MQHTNINRNPCPRCGGELKLMVFIAGLGKSLDVHYSECRDCSRIHVIECKPDAA